MSKTINFSPLGDTQTGYVNGEWRMENGELSIFNYQRIIPILLIWKS